MALIGLASAKGAPGVTTTATGLAAFWPEPCLLLEADLTGGSLIAGWFAGSIRHGRDLSQVAFTKARNPSRALAIRDHLTPLSAQAPDKDVLLGFATAAQSIAMQPYWGELASALTDIGTDVIIDFGRLAMPRDEREQLIRRVDSLLLVTSTDLPMAAATIEMGQHLQQQLNSAGRLTPLGLMTIGPARRVNTKTLQDRAGIPHLARIPSDPVRAEPITYGMQKPRRYETSGYVNALTSAAKLLHERGTQHRNTLDHPTL